LILFIKRAGLLLLLMIFVVTFLIINLYTPQSANSVIKQSVVIDAGHGSPDGGAVGTETGILEKDLTLSISFLIKEYLEQNGVNVIMTRTDDNGIHTEEAESIKSKKTADLKERVRIANQSNAALLISIHMNHFSDSKYSGPQMFYSKNVSGSLELATLLREKIIKHVGQHCTREIKPVTTELFLLKNCTIPAVIAECGFLSNPEEEKLLCDPEYQQLLATSISEAIIEYLE